MKFLDTSDVNEGLCVCAKSLQSCLSLCNPMNRNPPGSSVHGSLQARILKLQYFGHLMQRVNSLEKTIMLGKIGWMAPLTQ